MIAVARISGTHSSSVLAILVILPSTEALCPFIYFAYCVISPITVAPTAHGGSWGTEGARSWESCTICFLALNTKYTWYLRMCHWFCRYVATHLPEWCGRCMFFVYHRKRLKLYISLCFSCFFVSLGSVLCCDTIVLMFGWCWSHKQMVRVSKMFMFWLKIICFGARN